MDSDGIKKLAKLAKIKINSEEEEKFVNEFNQIFDFFEVLKKIPTDDVRPLTHVTATENSDVNNEVQNLSPSCTTSNIMREDEVQTSSVNRETALEAAERFGSFFKVPLVIGGDSA